MILSRKSSAWLLTALQSAFAILFASRLLPLTGPLGDSPTWLTVLLGIQFGLAAILALTALWRFELAAIVVLFAIHTVCPLLFFTDLTRNPYYTQIVLLNVWVAFVWMAWLWDAAQSGRLFLPRTPLDLPVGAFLGICTLSWALSFFSHPASFHPAMFAEGARRWLYTALNCLAVFYLAVMTDRKWRHRLIWTTFWVGTIAAVYGLLQFYGIEEIWQKSLTPFANRPVSTFGNPNFLSSYLMMLVPLVAVALLTARTGGSAWTSAVMLFLLIAGIIATMTRSTWVGTLAALALLLAAAPVREFIRRHRKRIALVAAAVAVAVLFWPRSRLGGYANPWQRVIEIREIKTQGTYGPWHQRLLIWSSCWNMMKDHPVFGKGWGLLELFYPYYQGRMLFNPLFRVFRTHANNAHNEVIEIWSQTGFVGMGIYFWLWATLLTYAGLCMRRHSEDDPDRALWIWALACGAVGMFTDNFFGNVSLHFAVPGMLFWWQAGLLVAEGRSDHRPPAPAVSEWRIWPVEDDFRRSVLGVVGLLFFGTCVLNFAKEFQEIHYFRGFKLAKATVPGATDQARAELESAWLWFPREVNTDYELANAYARLSQQAAQAGLRQEAAQWRDKAIWAYRESLRSNCGYDEIYFNLAATETQAGWNEDGFPDLTINTPRGGQVTERAADMHGSIYNYSRALAINPLSEEAYNFLGGIYIRDLGKYRDQAEALLTRGTSLFPGKRDLWLNLAYVQVQEGKLDAAYQSVAKAMALDPFYELTRKNLRALLAKMKRPDDPLGQADRDLMQVPALIKSRNWPALRPIAERLARALPASFSTNFLLGNVCTELRQWEPAEKAYEEALKIEPDNINALSNLAVVYRSTGRNDLARQTYRRILDIDGNNAMAKEQLKSLPS